MKVLLLQTLTLAGAMSAALGGVSAATVDYDFLPAGSYYAPVTSVSSGAPTFLQGVTGSIPSIRTSPFGDDTSPYDSVEGTGSATFGTGTGSGGFGIGSGTFTFVWGTPDPYNQLKFFFGSDPNPIATVNGMGDGSGSYLATVKGLGAFDKVEFTSGTQDAFEFAAVSAVPLPASLPMFGTAILGLGVLGLSLRQRTASKA